MSVVFRSVARRLLSLLKGAVIIYVMVAGILWFMQRDMLFHRSDGRPMLNDPSLIERREIVCLTTADGLALQSWYFPAAHANAPTVLFLHGNAGDIGNHLPYAKFLLAGYGLLALEYRGYGGNPGTPSDSGLYEDARAGFAFLQQQGIPDAEVVLFGESLGTGVAVRMASEHAVRALILRSPYSSIADVAAVQFPYFPARWLLRDKFDALSVVGQNHAPLFAFHGDADGLIPMALGRRLFDAAAEPKTWMTIPGAGHNDVQTPEAERAILDFLDRLPPLLPRAPAATTALPASAPCGT